MRRPSHECQVTGYNSSRDTDFIDRTTPSLCDGVALDRPRRRRRHAALRLQRGDDRRALPRDRRGVPAYPHALHYALKANSTLAIARLLRGLGSGADANSGGEIDVALRAGFIPEQIVFTGVGKTAAELAQAIDLGVKTINAESDGELERIDVAVRASGRRARASRSASTPTSTRAAIRTSRPGLKINKFGIAMDDVREICRRAVRPRRARDRRPAHARRLADHRPRSAAPRRRGARDARARAPRRRDRDRSPRSRRRPRRVVRRLAGADASRTTPRRCCPAVSESGLAIVLEPGRHIVAPAGALLSRVVDVKDRPDGKVFVILDAGMTELIRPMLYGAFHRSSRCSTHQRPEIVCDIVGPLCESSDTLGKDRRLPRPAVGDLMAVLDAGAYGAVMASNYNRRPMPAEVLVDGATLVGDPPPPDDRRSARAGELDESFDRSRSRSVGSRFVESRRNENETCSSPRRAC